MLFRENSVTHLEKQRLEFSHSIGVCCSWQQRRKEFFLQIPSSHISVNAVGMVVTELEQSILLDPRENYCWVRDVGFIYVLEMESICFQNSIS